MHAIDLTQPPGGDPVHAAHLTTLCQDLGYEYASYATLCPVSGTIHGFATYPADWQKLYLQQGFQRKDPTLWAARASLLPVDWAQLTRDAPFNSLFRAAGAFGITPQGLTVPIRGPHGDLGFLSVTRACSRREWSRHSHAKAGALQLAALRLHDHVMHSIHLHPGYGRPALSAREQEILQWIASGKSQMDVGDILSISHRTVEVHLRTAREKLSALTTAQAIGRAIGLGLIQPG